MRVLSRSKEEQSRISSLAPPSREKQMRPARRPLLLLPLVRAGGSPRRRRKKKPRRLEPPQRWPGRQHPGDPTPLATAGITLVTRT